MFSIAESSPSEVVMQKDVPNLGAAQVARGALVTACALTLCTLVSESEARDVGTWGGLGGQEFRSECNRNDVLIGFNIRGGRALDAIVPICIPLNSQRTEWAGQAYEPTQYFGGGGGRYEKMACKPGYAVKGVSVFAGPWGDLEVVKRIDLVCQDLDSGDTHFVRPNHLGGTAASVDWPCGDGEWGTGIYGRSGALVDQLGLVCHQITAAATPPPQLKPFDPVLVPTPSTGPSPFGDVPSKPTTPPQTSLGTCSVQLDTKVYDKPDGEGEAIGELKAPRKAPEGQIGIVRLYRLAEPCRDNWCHLTGSGVPNRDGWVYSGRDHPSLKCS